MTHPISKIIQIFEQFLLRCSDYFGPKLVPASIVQKDDQVVLHLYKIKVSSLL